MILQMARQEAERTHLSRVDLVLSKVAEKTLSDAIIAGSDAASDELRTSSYHFLMHNLTEMAATGGMEEIFDRIVERWAQSYTIIDAFVRRACTSSQYVQPVAKFIKQNL